MIPKKYKYTHEEKSIDVIFAGSRQTYDVMLIEDSQYLYAVIDIRDAITSPVNITQVLVNRRILEPDFWVFVDGDMAMEITKNAVFDVAPEDLTKYYFTHREQPVPCLEAFNIKQVNPNEYVIHMDNHTLCCTIDKEFKGIYLDKNHLFDGAFKTQLRESAQLILDINDSFFDSQAGALWLSHIFSAKNPFLSLGLWDALPINDRSLMITTETIPSTLIHVQKNNLEDQLFL